MMHIVYGAADVVSVAGVRSAPEDRDSLYENQLQGINWRTTIDDYSPKEKRRAIPAIGRML